MYQWSISFKHRSDQTDLQYQARGCGQGKVKRATGKASAWGPRPHFEREKASLVWACGAFEWCNQNSIWYADWRQAGGQGGPSKHGRNWQRKTAVSGSSPQLTLKKGAPGDQVWDLLCVQLASYLERGPLMWMMPLHLHVNQKPDYMIWWPRTYLLDL